MLPLLLLVLAFVPMAVESRRSRANDRALRARGAYEPANDVYPWMQVAYPASFVAMAAEAWLRHRRFGNVFVLGAVVFAVAKLLKYWAIATLGPRWTFRVLVPPGSARVTTGPYRFMRHPNYLAVLGEFVGMALMARAPVTGVLSLLLFGALILTRIKIEEAALARARLGQGALSRAGGPGGEP
jgi:methyltransferase